jgi:hypothetical protein
VVRADFIFFIDNPAQNPYFDHSWGTYKAPSKVELAMENDKQQGKFPVESGVSWKGRNALRLQWKSVPGGKWALCSAVVNWGTYDLTAATALVFRVNGPAAIGANELPDVALEDTANHKSTRAWMGDYVSGLDADAMSWQEVSIPLSVFQPGLATCDVSNVKTVYFLQRLQDGAEHVLWIDDLRARVPGTVEPRLPATPSGLTARGADSRIDLVWNLGTDTNVVGYYVYGADSGDGPFKPLHGYLHPVHLYSDFIGKNDATRYYYVTAVNSEYDESTASDVASAQSRRMTDEELLTSVQESAFRYFYDYGHPVSGLARERRGSGDLVTIGGSGFGLMTIMVGADRGFVSREAAAARIVKILKFLTHKATRYHGAWSHWLNGRTGETTTFGKDDDGGDLVETAFMAQGLLAVRKYFDRETADEKELRRLATKLWEGIEWDWYRQHPDSDYLFWHWSPRHGWKMNHPIRGYNECMIVYLLAIASPTHPVPPDLYYRGWTRDASYVNANSYYGYRQWVGWPKGGPLFFTHYSFLGFDPRGWRDRYCNYFENNRNITRIHRAYCIENPKKHKDYGELVWGMTASDNPWGYNVQEPTPDRDNGTISPTAAVSAFPYTPAESMATIRHFYTNYQGRLWGEFGFRDAFNVDIGWFADSVLAIDQGPMAPMIENHRTGLCWKYFMMNEEITRALEAIGWERE